MATTPIQDIPVSVNRSPTGKLNTDFEIVELRGGDYTDRENVEFNADGETFSDTPTLGNDMKTSLGFQMLQNQRVRIFLDKLFSSVTVYLFNKNRQILGYGIGYDTVLTSNSLAGNKAGIQAVFNSFAVPATFYNTQSDIPYIDIELAFEYSDFSLSLVDQDGQNVRYTILTEACSQTGVGSFQESSSHEFPAATFIWSTTQKEEYRRDKILYNLYSVGASIYAVIINHGYLPNQSIVISNATGLGTVANGEWVVTVIDANTVKLNMSIAGPLPNIAPAPQTYGGEVWINPYGVGAIGVQVFRPQTDSYQYIKLISSKKFNFVLSKQIGADGQANFDGYLLKYTDDYNVPRTFSYNGPFVENGALSVYNENGVYTYETLADEIRNIINYSSAEVRFVSQEQTGGNTPAGMIWYGVRFLTGTLASTEISFLSNPIPTYPPAYNPLSNDRVYGAAPGVTSTPKINRVEVTGFAPGVFDYVQLVAYVYTGGESNTPSVTAYNIRRESLAPEQTSIILEHNGNEPDITYADASDSFLVRPDILRVGYNKFLDNRLVYGKITTSKSIDIREWVKTFKYAIKRWGLYSAYGTETKFGFYDPESTVYRVGYQRWEWYRIYCNAELFSGKYVDTAFSFDVRFVTQADYDPDEFPDNGGPRRDLANDDFVDYGYGQGQELFQLYLEISGVDWDFRIDGVPARDLFRRVKICRAERVKEVIASGAISMPRGDCTVIEYMDGSPLAQDISTAPADSVMPMLSLNRNSPNVVVDYQLGGALWSYAPGQVPFGVTVGVTMGPVSNSNAKRKSCSFFAPDIIFGHEEYIHQAGDQLLNFGSRTPNQTLIFYGNSDPDDKFNNLNVWRIWNFENGVTSPQIVGIKEGVTLGLGENGAVNGLPYLKNFTGVSNSYGLTNARMYGSPVLGLDDFIVNQGGNTDAGLYDGIIFRRKFNKYGDPNNIGNTVIYTGSTINNGETGTIVFGGDVFTQQLQFRVAIPSQSGKLGFGFNLISQNIINVELRAYDPNNTTNVLAFPLSTEDYTIWLSSTLIDNYEKNIGYSIFNTVQNFPVFNPFLKDKGLAYSRKTWSQVTPNNSQTDRSREFMPFDFQDNPASYGDITGLESISGELFTYQQRGFTREFFNSVGRLRTVEDGNVNIGDGSVLSRPGLLLASRGTQHFWSMKKGFSEAGKDIVYWVDADYAAIMRFGADGQVNLSESHNITAFLRENLRFVIGKNSPAHDQGLHATWDDIGRNYILTCRAWKDLLKWLPETAYSVGDEIISGEKWGVPVIYKCIEDNTGVLPTSEGAEQYWLRIGFKNNEYYSLWTLVFNEKKNGFTHRHTFFPRIYHTQNKRYFAPSPLEGSESDIYRFRDKKARILNFFGEDHIGYTEYVINYMKNITKKFVALGSNSLLIPPRYEVDTQFISRNGIDNRTTFMTRADDVEMRENVAFTTIKNNLDSQGRNDQDTAPMRGLWVKIRTFFNPGEAQKINDTVVAVRMGQHNTTNP